MRVTPTRACSSFIVRNSFDYFEAYQRVVTNLPHSEVDRVIDELMYAYEKNSNIFLFGNGGSAALASHFACDLGKGTVVRENGHKRFRVMALTDNVPLMTAWANDTCYDEVFAQQLRNFIAPGDVAFAISASGNSPNILRALEIARSYEARTIGLTGFEGGKMKGLCDICTIIPSSNMQIIEDFQLSVTHAIFTVIREKICNAHTQTYAATGSAD
jgi:D-sedoheptulose 7-phosphate isomerase